MVQLKRATTTGMLLLCGGILQIFAEVESVQPLEPQSPPPAPPIQSASGLRSLAVQQSGDVYSIGNPTGEEQLYVELINRARANPTGEASLLKATSDPDVTGAYNFFHVDLDLMVSEFSALAPMPPLAINAKLTEAARKHSLDMFQNVFQGHTNSVDGGQVLSRVQAEGYVAHQVGENVFSFARSVWHGHAGFEVDWGPGPGGMQDPAGHRENIHTNIFREIGVGIVAGVNTKGNTTVGPQLVTQDFGIQFSDSPLITGVVYYDLDGDGFYTPGEGIGGITVAVGGQSASGITASSGGFAVPVSGDGVYTVTFSALALPPIQKTVTVANRENAKVDLTLPYAAPTLAGPVNPWIGKPNLYSISAVVGAASYDVRTLRVATALAEGAENGTNAVILVTNGLYNAFDTSVKVEGDHSFHLAHIPLQPGSAPPAQSVTLSPLYYVDANASLWFESRLGVSTTDEKALVQISTDEGVTWNTIYSQTGATVAGGLVSPGELNFVNRALSLKDYAGKLARFRFVYDFSFGSFIPSANVGAGWYIDSILFDKVKEATNIEVQSTALNQFTFTPGAELDFMMQARANMGDHQLPFGPLLAVHSVLGDPEIVITTIKMQTPKVVEVDFALRSGKTPAAYTLQGRSSLAPRTPWTTETGATFKALGNNEFSFVAFLPRAATVRFYRVMPN